MSQELCDLGLPSLTDDEHGTECLYWFRRCLRFHDNPALLDATQISHSVRCIYIIDPSTIGAGARVESNKWRFLLECLHDLDMTLRKHKSRLYVVQGQPAYILPLLFKDWHINVLSMEEDPTPYGARRDEAIGCLAQDHGVEVLHRSSHTLHSILAWKSVLGGKVLTTLHQFSKIFHIPGPPEHLNEEVIFQHLAKAVSKTDNSDRYNIPTLEQLGLESTKGVAVWKGGETEALKRLSYHLERRAWVACFDEPRMPADSLMASPNVIGPYLNFGCLSSRLVYWKMDELYRKMNGLESEPPVSLHGQLVLREFWYLMANLHRNFDQVEGNRLCLQVPWRQADKKIMKRVVMAKTGFPWIDAIMKQLVEEGWIHSMAKHALISFITHGQLFCSWEEAAQLLEKYCLEGDTCTNAGVAMLLSGSSHAKPIPSDTESPILTGKHIDPSANYIRLYLPVLRSFPSQYIYEPWTAPLDVQQKAQCVIGREYPSPMLEHYQALHSNMLTLQQMLKSISDSRGVKVRTHQRYPPEISSSRTHGRLKTVQ
ncbi:cryptochrome-1-like [Watersipora subatra]|uniref:cryptochrome-1-like n=1 Tax=Watersipora subatra TaxID=2589382 RepID=UPI00355C8285